VLLVGVWLALVWSARTDPDYSSGEILDSTMAWSESGRLYGSIDHVPYRVFNYPPAFPAAVRLLMAVGLPPLPAGRLLTLASIVLVVVLTYRWLRAAGCQPVGATLAVSLFASSFPLVFLVGQGHLQWPAVAASILGAYLLRTPPSAARVALAGGSLALACFFKHTQVWSLAVLGAWLLVHHRRAFRGFATVSGAVAALGLAVVFGVFGEEGVAASGDVHGRHVLVQEPGPDGPDPRRAVDAAVRVRAVDRRARPERSAGRALLVFRRRVARAALVGEVGGGTSVRDGMVDRDDTLDRARPGGAATGGALAQLGGGGFGCATRAGRRDRGREARRSRRQAARH
jgi:hypothetical protein